LTCLSRLALTGVLGTVLISADAAIRRERARNADKLRPQVSAVRRETPQGTEVETRVTGSVDQLRGDEADINADIVELLRRILSDRPGEPPQPVP
jgi:hypothetical protein